MKFRFIILIIAVLALSPLMVSAQVAYLDRPVSLTTCKTSLKAFLKTVSTQTECVFSYDPVKINENQQLSISTCTKQRMLTVLQKELPAYIQIKIHGKYVVLQKKSELDLKLKSPTAPSLKIQQSKPLPDYPTSLNDSVTTTVEASQPAATIAHDSTPALVELTPINLAEVATPLPATSNSDTTVNKQVSKPTPSPLKNDSTIKSSALPSTDRPTYSIGDFLRKDFVCQLELAGFNSMGALSLRLGAKNIYAIISLGGLGNNYNFGGLGLGVQAQVYKKFGMNVELLRHRISSGAAYNVGVRGTVGQLRGELNYSFNKTLSVFAGPSLVLITTSYYRAPITTNAESTSISLGRSLQLGLIAGVRMNIPALFYRKA